MAKKEDSTYQSICKLIDALCNRNAICNRNLQQSIKGDELGVSEFTRTWFRSKQQAYADERAEFIENVTLRNIMKKLNESLVSELDSTDLLIGHSYFMGKTEADICNIMNRNIIPLLYEYFYDNSKKVKALVETVTNGLGVAIKKEAMGRIKLEKQD